MKKHKKVDLKSLILQPISDNEYERYNIIIQLWEQFRNMAGIRMLKKVYTDESIYKNINHLYFPYNYDIKFSIIRQHKNRILQPNFTVKAGNLYRRPLDLIKDEVNDEFYMFSIWQAVYVIFKGVENEEMQLFYFDGFPSNHSRLTISSVIGKVKTVWQIFFEFDR
jgi:hypothetical protein